MKKNTFNHYVRHVILVSLFFSLYAFGYIYMRNNNIYLYFGSFIDYKLQTGKLFLIYFITVFPTAYVLSKSSHNIFLMLLSFLTIIGGLPGAIAYSQSSFLSGYYFFSLYIILIPILGIFSRPTLSYGHLPTSRGLRFDQLNISLLRYFAYTGLLIYIYLLLRYPNLISTSSFNDMYIKRAIFADTITSYDRYLIPFAKSIGAFSFLVLAVKTKNILNLIPLVFIFGLDYLLAANKSSIFLLVFSLFYYSYGSRIQIQKYAFSIILGVVAVMTAALYISINSDPSGSAPYVIGLYDRIFYVTYGLFARNFDFATNHYLFYGGVGLLGHIFGGVPENSYYTIGSYYFSQGVGANADMISDGYVNFGIAGAILQIIFLWLLISKKDNMVFSQNYTLIFPLTVLYGLALFSVGLQTALLTGSMVFFLILIKYGFKAGGLKLPTPK